MALRDGENKPTEVEHLTDEERKEKFATRSNEELIAWINLLCKTISKIDPLLQDLERDGIIQLVKESSNDQAV